MKKENDKTLAMKILDKNKIEYKVHEYSLNDGIDAKSVSIKLNEDLNKVYKTLVTRGKSNKYYVFLVEADRSLDLKKAAKVTHEKYIEMIHQAELLPLTGYVHGGCSPIGMNKLFPTFINIDAKALDTVFVSGGKIGLQIELNPLSLTNLINAHFEDVSI